VVGASSRPGSVAGEILRNIVRCGYTGTVYPVNPKYETVEGLSCYASVNALPRVVDLAVLAINKDLVLPVVEQCGAAGIANLVIITAGFKESGKEGIEREERLRDLIERYSLNVVGPNCMGIINSAPEVSLNASFSRWFPKNGEIAFVSQSGSLGETVLEFFEGMYLGVSQFVNLGNRAGLSENDFLAHLATDDQIRLIFLYLESLADPAEFRPLVEKIGRTKPVIVLKAGRTQAGQAAVASHTGSLATSDAIVDAFLTQSGAIRVASIREALTVLGAAKWGAIPKGRRTVILTNAGGAGIITADACERVGIEVPPLPPEVKERLASFLPPEAGLGNPIDMIATADSYDYEQTLRMVLSTADSAIVIFRPPLVFKESPEAVSEGILRVAKENPDKPILVCTLSHSASVAKFKKRLQEEKIPVYTMPETAVDALASLCRVGEFQRVQRSPDKLSNIVFDRDQAERVIDSARQAGRVSLTFAEGVDLLSAYGIKACPFAYVDDRKDALAFAHEARFPMVAKVDAPGLFHRFERGAVITGIANEEELYRAIEGLHELIAREGLREGKILLQPTLSGRELILGMDRDPSFGPVLMFGIGGTLVEALSRRSG
jgi:acetyltransferase